MCTYYVCVAGVRIKDGRQREHGREMIDKGNKSDCENIGNLI